MVDLVKPEGQRRHRVWKDRSEEQRRYRAKHKEAHAAYIRAYRLAHASEIAERSRIYHIEHRDKIIAGKKIYYAKNRVRIAKQWAEKQLRLKSMNAIRHDPDTVYRVVSRAVSSALPRFMRDDVINSMLLAVLEGELLLQHVGSRMKDYLGRYNREYDTFKTLSLDAPMGGTDLRRIDLLEAPAPYEAEDEDEDILMLKGQHFRL
ncbi:MULTISPECIES: hypothetical protein [unclassified Mesorhizobium]|uniref:hypothetical protein n=1 Tax=unclassified Mesorhizobium TaxID=325217 RepID=UPI00112CBA9D|nr:MULTISPECIES: hypothetical protein [unclassified Mesorhizobium]MCA0000987.1 hypothetical protein [Mesorhizobium sp. B264B2A]MCA0004736.1 hypothetical protein [Mesorhizobium sp. B264B1B]MCA0019065.1 hypothetical protein [Mesorhizobium sp. B264B1A]TPJ46708.1 hypothetical protein FJ437_13435 [Mesorhizobium sp. B2-6-6]